MSGSLFGFRAPPRVFSVGCVVSRSVRSAGWVVLPRSCGPVLGRSGVLGVLPSGSLGCFFCLAFRLVVFFPVGGVPVGASSSFVPSVSSVFLPGGCSAVVPVPSALGFGGGVVAGSAWVSRVRGVWVSAPSASASGLAVRFVGVSAPLVCLRAALPASGSFARLVSVVSSAAASGVVVFPVVAVGARGAAASGFFCGLSASAPSAPVAAAVPAGSFAS